MKLDQAVKYFGSQRQVAEILGLTESAVSVWKVRDKGLIPMRHILRLKDMSNGELDLGLDDYRP
jgi:predicted transcriptional regulator